MPTEGAKKSCTDEGCGGTMTYRKTDMPPGSRAGIKREGGPIMWGGSGKRGGWICDKNREHFEADSQ